MVFSGWQLEDRKLKSILEWPNIKVSNRNLRDSEILPKKLSCTILLAIYGENKYISPKQFPDVNVDLSVKRLLHQDL